MMRAEALVQRIIHEDAMHRKGTRPSEWTNEDVLKHLQSEVAELHDELVAMRESPEADAPLAAARDELCDVYAIVVHLKERLGLSLEDLDAMTAEKLPKRFALS